MASLNIQIIAGAGFAKQLQDGIRKQLPDAVFRRVLARRQNITRLVGDYLVSVFDQTDVAVALRGGSNVDLPAHFGLTDDQAATLASAMGELIRDSVTLAKGNENSPILLSVRALPSNWELFISKLPPGLASYISRPSGQVIPVARWMLIDPNVDVISASYEIVFGSNYFFAQTIAKSSRSGRALMFDSNIIEALGLASNGPYVLPSIVQKKGGNNFIEYTLGQAGVAETAMGIVFGNL